MRILIIIIVTLNIISCDNSMQNRKSNQTFGNNTEINDSLNVDVKISSISYVLTVDVPVPQKIEVIIDCSSDKIFPMLEKYEDILLINDRDTLMSKGSFFKREKESLGIQFIGVGLFLDLSENEVLNILKNCRLVFRNGEEEFTIFKGNEMPIITNYVKRRVS